ncbi:MULTISPECIES: pseudaminic acid synthase [unclassified Shewanella]|uniref:pseudaminic acid synthase n=1 Tax=unclassified Shewanella TaxID=196818 RepID=UPI001BBA1E9C|nr:MULTISPECIES: pseudaminic acid synthase [unclassified Shewanella]GIU14657.1 pseudaminic acid synthase [Shewanella sp. MBTL60-112-B1]GIU37806.1 pseudaminic acid synthase [Shewanella sp. MBTL60-112-B2]
MNNIISIDGRVIGDGHTPYIIAELSANHNGNIQTAFEIIAAAKKAGADAVKMQTYRPDTITIDCEHSDFQIEGGLWHGQSLYQLYEWAHTPWDWHKPLFDYARQLDITLFSSPFDTTAVDLLEDLNAPAYKIASFEAIDLPLIKYAAATGKPLIISTGMTNAEEIAEAIDAARSAGCKELAILHCVSAYPAAAEDYNLATLVDMKNRFKLVTGLSDHTLSNITAIAATSLGASIIEKHVTLDRTGGGPDDSFSLEPNELEQLCRDSKLAWSALGKVNYTRSAAEQANLKFRRSLYVVKDIKAGEDFSPENVRSIRPGFGLAPKYYDEVLFKKAMKDISRGTALTFDLVDYRA